jgi:2,3-bisphosphoglycerate-independent phosphoglycerate mutase
LKVLVLIGGGIADRPLPELEGRTALEAAATPAMDRIASEGEAGAWVSVSEKSSPSSDATIHALLGSGKKMARGPLEAAGEGIDLRAGEIACCANFVCLRPGTTSVVMLDAMGGGLSDEEGTSLADYLREHLPSEPDEEIGLRAMGGCRALLTYRKSGFRMPDETLDAFSPPHEFQGEPINSHLPSDESARRFVHIVNDSQMILSQHPGMKEKLKTRMFVANSLWLWGGGAAQGPPPLARGMDRRKLAFVSPDPAVAGWGRLCGAETIRPQNSGGAGRKEMVEAARHAAQSSDFVLVCGGEAAEASLRGDISGKTGAIEAFDREVVAPLIEDPGGEGPRRILLLVDHVLSPEPVPFAMAGWDNGRIGPPRQPGGLFGLWRRFTAPAPARADAFSEKLCENQTAISGKALLRRLLAA